jgi:hypothetical protein
MTKPDAPRRTPSRRTLVKGVTWATPVIATTIAAPAFAASRPCTPTFVSAQGGQADGKTVTMPTTTSLGTNTNTVASSVTGSALTPPFSVPKGTSYNMKFGTQSIDGGTHDKGARDRVVSWTRGNTLVLNQIGIGADDADDSTPDGVPSQTLTFSFSGPDGKSFNPANLNITIADISSSNVSPDTTTRWRDRYYDAVGFSTTPSRITASPHDAGTGTGSNSNPFRRSTADKYSDTGPYTDTFTFANATSGQFTMKYTQPGTTITSNNTGWQFIGITGISFDANC